MSSLKSLNYKEILYRYWSDLYSPLWIIALLDVFCFAIPYHDRLIWSISVNHLAHGEIWTLVTSIFMHVSVIHIMTNLTLLIIMLVVSNSMPINGSDTLICFFTCAILSDFLLICTLGLLGVKSSLMGSSSGIAGLVGFCFSFAAIMYHRHLTKFKITRFHHQITYSGYFTKLVIILFVGLYLIMSSAIIHGLSIVIGIFLGLIWYKKHLHYINLHAVR